MNTNFVEIEATEKSAVSVAIPAHIDVKFAVETTSAMNDSIYSIDENSLSKSVCSTHASSNEAVALLHYRNKLTDLVSKRKTYDAKLKSHDDTLYEILSQCLALSLDPQRNDENSALHKAIEEQRKSAGATRKIQKNTRFEHVVVRYVFAESCSDEVDSPTRAQVSSYAIVLSRAINEKVNQYDFVSWVKKCGGIDKIRRATHSIEEESLVSVTGSGKNIILLGKCIDKGVAIGAEVTIVGRYEGRGRMAVVTCEVSG